MVEEDASLQESDNTLSEDYQMENEEDYTLPDGSVVKAIQHVHLRTELLKAAEARCHWTHPQPHGDAPDDRTAPVAFPADQPDWGWTRQLYPPINFVLEKGDYKHPDYKLQDWYHKGRLVLDLDGKRMRDFHHLPVVCSTHIPGGHIEALMRVDDRTTYADIRGRMPPTTISKSKGIAKDKPQKGTNALSAAARTFRETAGMLSWSRRAGSEVFNNYILANVPADLKKRNTTRGWRDISKAEIATIREPGIGTRPRQARKRSSSSEARELREKNIKKRKAAASAERKRAAANNRSDDDLTISDPGGPDEGDISKIDKPVDEATAESDNTFTEASDIRSKMPSSTEEVVAIREAVWGTIDQARDLLLEFTPEFTPVLYEPHSYVWQMENIQKQFAKQWEILRPGQGKAPALIHLTSWSGGIQDWRSARFWDGFAQYLLKEDGTIGSRYSPESRPEEASDEDFVGKYPVDAGGSRIEARRRVSGETPDHTAAPPIFDDGDITADQGSHDGEMRYGPGGLLDWGGVADQENEQAGRTGEVGTPETLESNDYDLWGDIFEES
ncbi:MAG: hypothetical protein LQ339_002127 [Xanthoria mediterranea]|nr:MAG: hypothetical protein LQ339_002127 [Xanthoria mediterranea]